MKTRMVIGTKGYVIVVSGNSWRTYRLTATSRARLVRVLRANQDKAKCWQMGESGFAVRLVA